MINKQNQLHNQQQAARNRRNFGRIFLFSVSLIFVAIIGSFSTKALFKTANGVDLVHKTKLLYNQSSIIQAQRGKIVANNNDPLAEDTNTYSLYAVISKKQKSASGKPEYVQNKKKTAKILSENLPVSYDAAYKVLNPKNKKAFQVEFGNAGNNIGLMTKKKIEAHHLTGLNFVAKPARLYPNGVFASHIVGLASLIQNVKTKQNNLVGQMGIEQSFNKFLTGKNGFKSSQEDNYGYKIPSGDSKEIPAKNGDNVHTTINPSLQLLLENQMNKAQQEANPKSMNAILMDAKTGKIVAASQRPTFNPETGKGLGDVWRDTLTQDLYEPGSTMKVFSLASAIDSGHYNGKATYQSGKFQIGDAIVPDWNPNGWGIISFNQGFAMSSNVAMAHVEQLMGASTWKKYINRFQLLKNNTSQIDKQAHGIIQFKEPIEQANTAFGQGIQVTALQMLQGFTAIANNGEMIQPQFISKVTDSKNKKVVKSYSKKVVGHPIKASTAISVRKHMEDAVYKPYAVGQDFKIDGYKVAAKTGTAQVTDSSGQYGNGNSSYLYSVIEMVPASHPRYIMYVTMKQPQNISTPTTKVMGDDFNVVMKKALENKITKVKTAKIPKVAGDPVSAAQNKLNSKGIQNVVIGKGNTVVKQNPSAEAPKDLSRRVMLLTDGRMTMPDLTGWSREEVEDFASLTNIKVSFNGEGNVTAQSIKANDEFDEHAQLDVNLSN